MANYGARTGILDRNSWVLQLQKDIDLMWTRRWRFSGVLKQFFETITMGGGNGLTYKMNSAGSIIGLPQENDDTDQMPFDAPVSGFEKEFLLVNYRLALQATDTLRRTERYSKLAQGLGGLIKSAMTMEEYQRASVFNNAFSGTAGADSLALCANSHPHVRDENGTWDNLGTGVLTGANLHALELLGRKLTNEGGYPDPLTCKTLLVPPENKQKAHELTAVTGVRSKPETALNDPNVIIAAFNVVDSPYLTNTDDFFLIGDREGDEKGLYEVEVMAADLSDIGDATVDVPIRKRIKQIRAFGYSTSQNVLGSAGA